MTPDDEIPAVWAGHINMDTDQLRASADFFLEVGMRPVFENEIRVILELRAGTHLVLSQVEDFQPGPVSFDLMVEDLDATHARFTDAGLNPGPIGNVPAHRAFDLTEPAGNTVTVFDSHNTEFPV